MTATLGKAQTETISQSVQAVVQFSINWARTIVDSQQWETSWPPPDKWFYELADLVYQVNRFAFAERSGVRELGELLATHVQRPTLVELVRAGDSAHTLLASSQALLHAAGFPYAPLDEVLHQTLARAPVRGVERLPSKAMRTSWLCGRMGLKPYRAAAEYIAGSAVDAESEEHFTLRDTYHLCHAIWFLTDYGLDREAVRGLARWQRPLARLLDRGEYQTNPDVLAEILMAYVCLAGTDEFVATRMGRLGLGGRLAAQLGSVARVQEYFDYYHEVQVIAKCAVLCSSHEAVS